MTGGVGSSGVTTDALSKMLAPVTVEDFTRHHAFKRPLVVRGSTDKFASLFTWDSLNRILSYSRHDPVRVHLNRVGASEEQLGFTRTVANVRGEPIERVDVELLYQRLRQGATLVVDAVNEVDPGVAALTEDLAVVFSSPRTTTVLFASFGHDPGFIVHWDNRDVYALQVEGEKHWSVYEPSLVAPLGRGDVDTPGSGVPGSLVWEGTLRKGDMIYVPRRWWHDVTSVDRPSLHLNVGVAPVTALDLLRWYTERLEDHDLMRLDIPRLGTPDELDEYERSVRQAIAAGLADLRVSDFLAAVRAKARVRRDVCLPVSLDGEGQAQD